MTELSSSRSAISLPNRNRKFVLVAAILASAMGFLDGSILALALPAIRADLHADLVAAQWFSNGYALMLSALILVGGAAGDMFGVRRVFIVGIAIFVGASLLCAFSQTAGQMIGFRGIQGIGAAIMVPCSLAIIAKAYPKAERGRAIGIWAASSGLTTSLGPVIGGLLLSLGIPGIWRVIFAINLPLGAAALYLLVAKAPADAPKSHQKLDLAGALLATASLGLICFGLTALGEGSGASHRIVGPALAAGVVVAGVFIWWERHTDHPMINLGLFRIGSFRGANIATFTLYFALSAVTFFLPMVLIAGWRLSPGVVGFAFLPLSAAIALLSGPVGAWADRVGPKLPIAIGSAIVGVSFAAMAWIFWHGNHAFWTALFPASVVMGLGMALVVSPLSTAIMTSVDDKDTGAASGINNAVSRIGGLFAVASMGALAVWVYGAILMSHSTMTAPAFGELTETPDLNASAASDAAFAAVAACSAVLCFASALVAATSIAGKPVDRS